MDSLAGIDGLDTHHEPPVVSKRRLLATNKRIDERGKLWVRPADLTELRQKSFARLPREHAIPNERSHHQLELPLPCGATIAQKLGPRELDDRVLHAPLRLLAYQLDRPPGIAIPVARLRFLASHPRTLARACDSRTPCRRVLVEKTPTVNLAG